MGTATETCDGYRHHAVIYDSDRTFVDTVGQFITDGIEAGEPVLLGLADSALELLRGDCDLSNPLVAADGAPYANPVRTIHEWLRRFRDLVASGEPSMRAIGEVPHSAVGADWYAWARYEAVINRAFADLPLWCLCPYDARLTPQHVLDDVTRTHPFMTTVAGHAVNPVYEQPEDFLGRLPAPPGLGDDRSPDLTLLDPTPREARWHLEILVARLALPAEVTEDLHVAVSELVSNARRHGARPVRADFWVAPDRIEVTVTDPGEGPADPFVGWIPPEDALASGGGRGLWLTYQLAPTLDVWIDEDRGFTARISVSA